MISDEIKAQRQKMKGKGFKAQMDYFWTYYKVPFLILILAIIVAIYVIHYYATKKDEVFGLTFLNIEHTSTDDTETKMRDDLEKDLNQLFSLKSSQTVDVDNSRYQTPGSGFGSTDLATQSAILASMSAGTCDVTIMDAWNYEKYMSGGAYLDLRTVLSDEELQALSGKIYYADRDSIGNEDEDYSGDNMGKGEEDISKEEAESKENLSTYQLPDPSTMKDPVPVGILVNDSPYLSKYKAYEKSAAILGVCNKTKNKKRDAQFIKFIMEND
ncbi:MAG: hypothetical protein PUG16_08005 [Lachnospiraceae bacterium]|nr:hypothetical protein [Lachnospiraceae bacterium]